jgi:hypothetical protein
MVLFHAASTRIVAQAVPLGMPIQINIEAALPAVS